MKDQLYYFVGFMNAGMGALLLRLRAGGSGSELFPNRQLVDIHYLEFRAPVNRW